MVLLHLTPTQVSVICDVLLNAQPHSVTAGLCASLILKTTSTLRIKPVVGGGEGVSQLTIGSLTQ